MQPQLSLDHEAPPSPRSGGADARTQRAVPGTCLRQGPQQDVGVASPGCLALEPVPLNLFLAAVRSRLTPGPAPRHRPRSGDHLLEVRRFYNLALLSLGSSWDWLLPWACLRLKFSDPIDRRAFRLGLLRDRSLVGEPVNEGGDDERRGQPCCPNEGLGPVSGDAVSVEGDPSDGFDESGVGDGIGDDVG